MKKILIIIVAFIIISNTADAQKRYFDERGIFSMHHLYPVIINPGAIGANDYGQVFLNYRNSWSDFDGSPNTVNLSYDGPIADKLGLGIQVLNDSYGALNTTKGVVGASYTIKSAENTLGLGITAEYIQHKVSTGDFLPETLEDPEVFSRLDGTQFFDVSFGLYGRYQESLIYGVSFPSLVSAMISDGDDIEEASEFGFIGQVGYELKIEEYGMVLTPMLTFKNLMFTPFHTDINVNAKFLDDRLVGGLGYTVGGDNRLSFLIGTNIRNLSLYYSYNSSSNDFQTYNNGSHEVTLGYKFINSESKEMN